MAPQLPPISALVFPSVDDQAPAGSQPPTPMWRGVPFNSGLRKDLPLPLDAIPAAARAGLLATARAARTAQQVRPCLVWRTNLRVSSGLAWVPSRSPQDVFPPRLANAQRVWAAFVERERELLNSCL
ncbi:hypothetical protein ACCO45_012906 [Purpureocillium lilacinum]|uniref:Uncharacterized protein n=1 Tax=Purpureocillium lilacinum TaxID=33203 RepID=A0ACC4DA06_PURLI